jgi:hypothetical protein
MANKEDKQEIIIVSDLVDDGVRFFESSGYSVIRITDDGNKKTLKIPISTDGVRELMDELSAIAPRAPVVRKMIEKDSDEGKKLEISENTMVMVFDLTDEKYVDALDEHTRHFTWKVVAKAIRIGPEDLDEKIELLKKKGITKNQVLKIYKDVMNLTNFAEDREDFLSGNVWA